MATNAERAPAFVVPIPAVRAAAPVQLSAVTNSNVASKRASSNALNSGHGFAGSFRSSQFAGSRVSFVARNVSSSSFSVENVATPPKVKNAEDFELLRDGVKKPAAETALTPRFYTTDFEELEKLILDANVDEIIAINEEFKNDYNRDHFVRDAEFDQSWDHISGDKRKIFVEFLERSCTAEFSGFLLYKEIARRLKDKNPVLAESFQLMSRDEARHAGFLNKALSDFKLQLDLGFLTKNRSYTYFKPKFIMYATYLSEKIGYWRYICIYRHLAAHPEDRIYPIFKYFEAWCQDENRHGDFLDAFLRSQPQWLNDTKAKWWCRFFLLSVFATMYLNDLQRSQFYAAIGLNAREYDIEVIRKTNANSSKVFPVILDVEHPTFFPTLDQCANDNLRIVQISEKENPSLAERAEKAMLQAGLVSKLLRIFLLPPIEVKHEWAMVK